MPIIAENTENKRDIIPQGNYVARCYQMIEIGTIHSEYMGQPKSQRKVRIGWELPTELKVFKEENGEQPLVISNEYTISTSEKSNLIIMLESWRGQKYSDEQRQRVDITKLIGQPCMLNVIHNEKDGKVYANIASITPLPKGLNCPPPINKEFVLSYDNFDVFAFDTLPTWIKDKMKTTPEYLAAVGPIIESNDSKLTQYTKEQQGQMQGAEHEKHVQALMDSGNDDLPF